MEAARQFEASLDDEAALDYLDFVFHRSVAEATNNGAFIEFFSLMNQRILPQPAFYRACRQRRLDMPSTCCVRSKRRAKVVTTTDCPAPVTRSPTPIAQSRDFARNSDPLNRNPIRSSRAAVEPVDTSPNRTSKTRSSLQARDAAASCSWCTRRRTGRHPWVADLAAMRHGIGRAHPAVRRRRRRNHMPDHRYAGGGRYPVRLIVNWARETGRCLHHSDISAVLPQPMGRASVHFFIRYGSSCRPEMRRAGQRGCAARDPS